jgi:hypothetical protein
MKTPQSSKICWISGSGVSSDGHAWSESLRPGHGVLRRVTVTVVSCVFGRKPEFFTVWLDQSIPKLLVSAIYIRPVNLI